MQITHTTLPGEPTTGSGGTVAVPGLAGSRIAGRRNRPSWTSGVTRLLLAAIAFFALFTVWSIGFVPPNQDEFNHPHRLACLYPNAHLNSEQSFIIGCDSYLIDYGIFAYHRGFQYIGATSSVLYFPLWKVWRSPYSYFAKGLVFLLLFAFLLVRALNLEWRYALIALCYFPVAYSFIHDTGPVRLSLLSYPLIVLAMMGVLGEGSLRRRMASALAAALLIVVCVEDKPFYVFLLPSLAIFVVGCRLLVHPARSLREDVGRSLVPVAAFVAASAAGIAFLLFAGTTEGQTYFEYLRDAPENRYRTYVQGAFIGAFTFSWPRYTHRVFDVSVAWQAVAGLMTLIVAAWTLTTAWRTGSPGRRLLCVFLSSYLLGVLVFLLVRTPWAGHHYVFLHVPLLAILLWVARQDGMRFRMSLGAAMALSLIAISLSSASEIDPKSVRERTRIFSYVSQPEIASSHIINFSSFGGYYQQALFGHDSQLVTWSHSGRRNREPAIELERLAGLTSRAILNICRDCDEELMRGVFATDRVTEVDLDLRHWKVFRIIAE